MKETRPEDLIRIIEKMSKFWQRLKKDVVNEELNKKYIKEIEKMEEFLTFSFNSLTCNEENLMK